MLLIMKPQRAFTLIEMIVVVGIISIIVAIAIPTYTNYMRKSMVAEALNLLTGFRTQAEEWGISATDVPKPASISVKTTGKYTKNIVKSTENTLCYEATLYDDVISGGDFSKVIMFCYNHSNSNWDCDESTIEDIYLPSACKP